MKNLLSELKRWSLGTESAIAGRIDVATRSRRTVRKAPRARAGTPAPGNARPDDSAAGANTDFLTPGESDRDADLSDGSQPRLAR